MSRKPATHRTLSSLSFSTSVLNNGSVLNGSTAGFGLPAGGDETGRTGLDPNMAVTVGEAVSAPDTTSNTSTGPSHQGASASVWVGRCGLQLRTTQKLRNAQRVHPCHYCRASTCAHLFTGRPPSARHGRHRPNEGRDAADAGSEGSRRKGAAHHNQLLLQVGGTKRPFLRELTVRASSASRMFFASLHVCVSARQQSEGRHCSSTVSARKV